MRKITILGLCLAAGLTASAQMDLVKEVERTVKSGNYDYATVKSSIDAITTNPESKDNVKTWIVAGNAAFGYYDALFLKEQMGQDVDKKQMGNAIIDGYEYLMKALPLDTVIDDKGKVKTKESKNIVKTIANNYNHFNNAGIYLWQCEDYAGAYKAWDIYVNLPQDPRMEKTGLKANPDTIVAASAFNQALAAYQLNDWDNSLAAFNKAFKLGYSTSDAYVFAIQAAYQAKKTDIAYQYATEAYPKFGSQNPMFLQVMINYLIEKKEYAQAREMLNGFLASDPNNAEYYDLMGVLYENEENTEEAINAYKKAVELNGSSAIAKYHLGTMLYKKAYNIDNEASSKPQAEYDKIRKEQTEPLLREAAKHLEDAYNLDDVNMGDALKQLRNIYYILGDEANQKRVETM